MSKFEEWQKEYYNKPIINFYNDLTKEDIEIFEKLGIKINNKLYTEYEYEILKIDLGAYYKDDDMGPEDLKYVKPLEKTGVSREKYNELLEKIDNLEEKYSKLYSKIIFQKD